VVDFTGGLLYFKEETNQTITDTAAALSFLPGIGLVGRQGSQSACHDDHALSGR
jgi:hypothetical protein